MYLLFDIGGTKMRFAISMDGATLDDVKIFDTPVYFEDAIEIFSNFKRETFRGIVGGIAGVRNKEKTTLVHSPNLQGWVGKPIKANLEELFETRVILENDAALAGLGEACFGIGKNNKIIAYLTISTGIGGARIVDGKIDDSVWGFEPGKQIIDADVSIWPESVNFDPKNLPPGSIESYISGSALNFRYGMPPSKFKNPNIWKEAERLLAVVINNTIVYWSPEVIILGGGMVFEGAVSLDNIYSNLSLISVFSELPELKKAELGDRSALYGALSTVQELR